MNVLIIPTWYPSGADKLMGIYHKEYAKALASRDNIKVNMLFIDRQRLNKPFKYLFGKKKEIEKEDNYQVYIYKMLNVSKISEDLQMKRYVKKLDKAFLEYLKNNPKPDIIHAMVSIPSGYASVMLGKKYNIPVIVTEHASYFERFFKGKNKKYGDVVLKNAYFTTVSNYMLKLLPDNIKKDVLPNLVDTDIFMKYKRKKIKGLRVVLVSALREGKNLETLFKATKIIVSQGYDIKVVIVGDGYLEDYYKNKCLELKMDAYIDFVGRKTKEEIALILQANNIFVITSKKETFCIPGIEALASGMPVIATKCGGPEEYIDENCGKLVEIDNYEEMAQAIIEVYQNLDNYDVNYLRNKALNYSGLKVTDKAIKIYKEIIKERENI